MDSRYATRCCQAFLDSGCKIGIMHEMRPDVNSGMKSCSGGKQDASAAS